jgi:hypothetical protein
MEWRQALILWNNIVHWLTVSIPDMNVYIQRAGKF